MKIQLVILISIFITSASYGVPMSPLQKYASEVPVQKINQDISSYLENEIAYSDSFKSDYTLAEYKDLNSGKTWYVLDGYYTLNDKTVLFLDFNYNPEAKTWSPINNYAFVPEENKRFLLKADEVCNPYKRHFIGVVMFAFKEAGHLDEVFSFFNKELHGSPMLYTDGSNHMFQDLTAALGSKPLFTLNEEDLVKKMANLVFIKGAMIIPSGRGLSDDKISQTYESVAEACKGK